jgi:hypothetical protein
LRARPERAAARRHQRLLDFSGNTLENSPKWEITSIAQHTSASSASSRPERHWTLEASVQNLEDETIYDRVIVGRQFTAGMPLGITPYQARTHGLRVGYAWGSE